jgi:7-cyano-7-deazaguanine synthase
MSDKKSVSKNNLETIVIHSGGMDSSLCLAKAVKEDFGGDASKVLSLSFQYGQRHSEECVRAEEIAKRFGVRNENVVISCLEELTNNALINQEIEIQHKDGEPPNTMVIGRNGLMARLGAIYAQHLNAEYKANIHSIYMGVIEVEHGGDGVGYRDCSREYMGKMQEILRMDLADPKFEIRTPIVFMTKRQTMDLGHRLGVLEYLLERTITCYKGVPLAGCRKCPSCILRNDGLREFLAEHPEFEAPFEP